MLFFTLAHVPELLLGHSTAVHKGSWRPRKSCVCWWLLGCPESSRCNTSCNWAVQLSVGSHFLVLPFALACALCKASGSPLGNHCSPHGNLLWATECRPPSGRKGCVWPCPPVPAGFCSHRAQLSFRAAGVNFHGLWLIQEMCLTSLIQFFS